MDEYIHLYASHGSCKSSQSRTDISLFVMYSKISIFAHYAQSATVPRKIVIDDASKQSTVYFHKYMLLFLFCIPSNRHGTTWYVHKTSIRTYT